MNPIKILFVLPSLRAGGAERIVSFLSQNLNQNKFECVLLVVGNSKDVAYDVSKVKTIFLNKERVLKGVPGILKIISREKPDIAMSSIGHLNMLLGFLAFYFPKIKFVIREANVNGELEKIAEKNKSNLSAQIGKLFGKTSKAKIKKIICQSDDMYDDLKQRAPHLEEKMVIINNPIVHLPKFLERKKTSDDFLQLITVGRLCNQKGQLRLIEMLGNLDLPYHYTLIGDGPKKEEIFQKIESLGIGDKITHVSFTKEVPKYLLKSDIFLQGSYVEGFPNALIESLVMGTPGIVFDTPGGTREIIIDEINGYKVNSAQEFIKAIKKIYTGKFNSSHKTIRDSVVSRYSSDKILDQYETMFEELV